MLGCDTIYPWRYVFTCCNNSVLDLTISKCNMFRFYWPFPEPCLDSIMHHLLKFIKGGAVIAHFICIIICYNLGVKRRVYFTFLVEFYFIPEWIDFFLDLKQWLIASNRLSMTFWIFFREVLRNNSLTPVYNFSRIQQTMFVPTTIMNTGASYTNMVYPGLRHKKIITSSHNCMFFLGCNYSFIF